MALIVWVSPTGRDSLAQNASLYASSNGSSSSVAADDVYQVQRLSGSIELDGLVEEDAWAAVPVLLVVMQWPSFGESPSEQTEIKIAYDDSY